MARANRITLLERAGEHTHRVYSDLRAAHKLNIVLNCFVQFGSKISAYKSAEGVIQIIN